VSGLIADRQVRPRVPILPARLGFGDAAEWRRSAINPDIVAARAAGPALSASSLSPGRRTADRCDHRPVAHRTSPPAAHWTVAPASNRTFVRRPSGASAGGWPFSAAQRAPWRPPPADRAVAPGGPSPRGWTLARCAHCALGRTGARRSGRRGGRRGAGRPPRLAVPASARRPRRTGARGSGARQCGAAAPPRSACGHLTSSPASRATKPLRRAAPPPPAGAAPPPSPARTQDLAARHERPRAVRPPCRRAAPGVHSLAAASGGQQGGGHAALAPASAPRAGDQARKTVRSAARKTVTFVPALITARADRSAEAPARRASGPHRSALLHQCAAPRRPQRGRTGRHLKSHPRRDGTARPAAPSVALDRTANKHRGAAGPRPRAHRQDIAPRCAPPPLFIPGHR
jgi:hypothetical protein